MFESRKKMCLLALFIFATALLAGCFQVERTVRLNADGSGTVEETMLLGKSLTEMFDKMAGGDEASGTAKASPKSTGELLAEEEKTARANAAGMGDGVSLVSVTPVTRGAFEGYRVVYSFKDINSLKLQADPTPTDQGGGSGKANTYLFTRGESNVLVFKSGAVTGKDTPTAKTEPETRPSAEQNKQNDQEALNMLKQIFDGMRISERIIINDGTIIESNALFRNGQEITLFDIDFGKILATNPEELMKLQAVPQGDKQKMLLAMSMIPGFRVDLNDELKVVFRQGGK
jgi:hypothetical protein